MRKVSNTMKIRPIDIKVFETCIGFLAADIQMAVPGSTVECKVSFLHRKFSAMSCSIIVGVDAQLGRISLMGSFEQVLASHHLLYSHVLIEDKPDTFSRLRFDKEFTGDITDKLALVQTEDSDSLQHCQGEVSLNGSVSELDGVRAASECMDMGEMHTKTVASIESQYLQEIDGVEEQNINGANLTSVLKPEDRLLTKRKDAKTQKILPKENVANMPISSDKQLHVASNEPPKIIRVVKVINIKPKLNTNTNIASKSNAMSQEIKALPWSVTRLKPKLDSVVHVALKNDALSQKDETLLVPVIKTHYSMENLKKMSKYFYLPFSIKRKRQTREDIVRIVSFANIVSGIMSNAWLYSCPRCKMLADSLAALNNHMVIEHEGSSEAEAFSVAMSEANNASAESEFFFTAANYPDVFFSSLSNIQDLFVEHVCLHYSKPRVPHNDKVSDMQCPKEECNERFSQVTCLINHLKDVHSDIASAGEISCWCCSHKCCNVEDFRRHVEAYHSLAMNNKLRYAHTTMIQCAVCSLYSSHFHLANHAFRSHPGQEGFKCETCGKAFFAIASWKKHIKVHVLGSQSEKTQTQKVGLVCEFCGQQFVLNKSLQRHLEEIHNHLAPSKLKPFKCALCGSSFISEASLRMHIDKFRGSCMYHRNAKSARRKESVIVTCADCGKKFRGDVGLALHMAWKHNGRREKRVVLKRRRKIKSSDTK